MSNWASLQSRLGGSAPTKKKQKTKAHSIHHRAPQNKTAEGPDVAPALPTFKDEPTRALRNKLGEQTRGWNVQKGSNPFRLQSSHLIGAASGHNGKGRSILDGFFDLLFEQVQRSKAQ